MAQSDPANFLQSIVKIKNTSRNEVNGLCGAAVNYDSARARYSIVLSNNPRQILSLKSDNLEKASFIEGTKAKYLLAKYQINQSAEGAQIKRVWDDFSKAYLPSQLQSPEKVLAIAGLILALLVYYIGFMKLILLFSLFSLPLLILAEDILAGSIPSVMAGLKMLPTKLCDAIRTSTGYNCSERIAVTVIAVFYTYSVKLLLATTPSRTRKISSNYSNDDMERFYKLGYDDGKLGMQYGTSLISPMDDYNNGPDVDYTNGTKSGMFSNISSIISLMVVSRSLMSLAQGPNGLSPANIPENVKRMEPWRMGMLAFSVYRVIKSFI